MEKVNSQTVRFNAGLNISENLLNIFKFASICKLKDDIVGQYEALETAETEMTFMFEQNPEAKKEVENIKSKYAEAWSIFKKKQSNNYSVPGNIYSQCKEFLNCYHKRLIYYRDRFGYGATMNEDVFAANEEWK